LFENPSSPTVTRGLALLPATHAGHAALSRRTRLTRHTEVKQRWEVWLGGAC
jgi:hypothetical protein